MLLKKACLLRSEAKCVLFSLENLVAKGTSRKKEFLLNTFLCLLNFELYTYIICAKLVYFPSLV